MRHAFVLRLVVGMGLVLGMAGAGMAGEAVPAGLDAWLKQAGFGPYQEARFDAEALYQKAKAERRVTVYSYSSRIVEVARTFEQRYPGIKVQPFDMDSAEIVTKVLAEQTAKNYAADVVYMKDPSTALNVLKAFPACHVTLVNEQYQPGHRRKSTSGRTCQGLPYTGWTCPPPPTRPDHCASGQEWPSWHSSG